jgi:uncharacterized protein (UPF0332 family)
MLSSEERKVVVSYRIQKAYSVLGEAKDVAKLEHWSLVGNRLYYAAFHMATALILDKGLSAKTHGGTIHLIGAKFVLTGLLNKEYGRLFSRLYELRQSGDYDDMYDATQEEVEPYIQKTEYFLKAMEELITNK